MPYKKDNVLTILYDLELRSTLKKFKKLSQWDTRLHNSWKYISTYKKENYTVVSNQKQIYMLIAARFSIQARNET